MTALARKVERFFRTVRERFSPASSREWRLQELDQIFWIWLQEELPPQAA